MIKQKDILSRDIPIITRTPKNHLMEDAFIELIGISRATFESIFYKNALHIVGRKGMKLVLNVGKSLIKMQNLSAIYHPENLAKKLNFKTPIKKRIFLAKIDKFISDAKSEIIHEEKLKTSQTTKKQKQSLEEQELVQPEPIQPEPLKRGVGRPKAEPSKLTLQNLKQRIPNSFELEKEKSNISYEEEDDEEFPESMTMEEADLMKQIYLAKQAKIKFLKESGIYVNKDEMIELLSVVAEDLKKSLLNIPERVANLYASMHDGKAIRENLTTELIYSLTKLKFQFEDK
jgi:hypothetical protein